MRKPQAALAALGVAFAITCLGVALTLAVSACGTNNSRSPRDNAKVEPVAKAMPVSGPVLHGKHVVWGTGSIEGGEPIEPIRIFSGQPGRLPRLLNELPRVRKRPESLGSLAGSPEAVAFVRGWDICSPPDYQNCGLSGADVRVGAENRRFHPLEATSPHCAQWSPDIDGTRVALIESCSGPCPCQRIVVDDVADSKPPEIVRRSWRGFEQVELAGKYVAGSTMDEIFVHDLATGRRLTYKPPLGVPWHIGPQGAEVGDLFRFDIQADGKAVAMWTSDNEVHTGWFSPKEPEAHSLPFDPFFDRYASSIGIRLARDRVAFERRFDDEKAELVVGDLAGKVEQVATFDRKHLRVGGFDFDGKRFTWASQEVASFEEECTGPPENPRRYCRQRPVPGPTTIYLARLDQN